MGVYVYRNDQVEGPFDELVLQQALMNGTMRSDEPCCREGSEDWMPASGLFARVPPVPTTPALVNVQATTSPSSSPILRWRAFWSRLSKAQIVALSIIGTLVGLFLLFCLLVASVAPSPPTASNPRQSIETRLAELKAQDAQIDLQSQGTASRAAGLMMEVAQVEENKRQGFYTPPEEVQRITQQYMAFLMETARIDKARKEVSAEREELTKRLSSM